MVTQVFLYVNLRILTMILFYITKSEATAWGVLEYVIASVLTFFSSYAMVSGFFKNEDRMFEALVLGGRIGVIVTSLFAAYALLRNDYAQIVKDIIVDLMYLAIVRCADDRWMLRLNWGKRKK